ncbi:MAG TPA: TfuA-like protein [Allosphingosinicella sp.]|nr:TfuA-like protein [Allosphingosinicella sp.]
MGDQKIAVFLGPSCAADEARIHLKNADYYPPAFRGSFYNIINDQYDTIVLIDGLFYGNLSVWHKEIIHALDCGIEVIGASSMGALRAAELQGTGMTGVGTIFGWYRDGTIDGDDEVALLHGGEADEYAPHTIPLVNLRWKLAALKAEGSVTSQAEALIIESARQLCFTERTIDKIIAPLAASLDGDAVKSLLESRTDDLKKTDAVLALDLVRDRRVPPSDRAAAAATRPYELIHINAGIEYYQRERLVSIRPGGSRGGASLQDYLTSITLPDPAFADLVRARSYQRLIVGWARELGLESDGCDTRGELPSKWDAALIGPEHRQATGLTVVDIAREALDERLCQAMQQRHCGEGASSTLDALDRRLSEEASASSIPWQRMIQLDGRLLDTLWRLGVMKGIAPGRLNGAGERGGHGAPGGAKDEVEPILSFAQWIDETGLKLLGYSLDPAREILLAHQFLNCLDRLEAGLG